MSKVNFRPAGKRILIEPDKRDLETTSKLIINVKEQISDIVRGTVISVGEEVTRYKEGDEVVFLRFHGQDIVIEDKEETSKLREKDLTALPVLVTYYIINELDIFGWLDEQLNPLANQRVMVKNDED